MSNYFIIHEKLIKLIGTCLINKQRSKNKKSPRNQAAKTEKKKERKKKKSGLQLFWSRGGSGEKAGEEEFCLIRRNESEINRVFKEEVWTRAAVGRHNHRGGHTLSGSGMLVRTFTRYFPFTLP